MSRPDRPALSRDVVVQSAIEYVDEHGLNALTMRALGQRLGVEAMSIYHYVNGREELLESIVRALVGRLRTVTEEDLSPTDGWQAFLQHMAHGVRALAVEHPNLFPLVATRPPAAPWLRPPLRSLEVVEDFLRGLTSRGLPDDAAVHIYKVFTSFLLGHLLLEVAVQGAQTGPVDEPLDEGDATAPTRDAELSVDDYPTVVRLAGLLRRHDTELEFEAALEAMLVRLDTELSQ